MEDFTKWLPSLLVVIGWIIVNHQNNKRETRKECRSLIDDAKAAVIDVAAKAVLYHTEAKKELSVEILAAIDALEIECERLPNWVKGCPLMGCHAAFANAMTGGDFDSAEVEKKAANSPQVISIVRTRTEMLSELERIFRVHYLGGGSKPS